MISSSLLGKELWKSYVGQVQLLLPHHSCICIKSTWAFQWNKQARSDSVFSWRVIGAGVPWLNPGKIDRLFLFPRGRRTTLCQGGVQLAIRHWRGAGWFVFEVSLLPTTGYYGKRETGLCVCQHNIQRVRERERFYALTRLGFSVFVFLHRGAAQMTNFSTAAAYWCGLWPFCRANDEIWRRGSCVRYWEW